MKTRIRDILLHSIGITFMSFTCMIITQCGNKQIDFTKTGVFTWVWLGGMVLAIIAGEFEKRNKKSEQ